MPVWPPAPLPIAHVIGEVIDPTTDNAQADLINTLVEHVVVVEDALAVFVPTHKYHQLAVDVVATEPVGGRRDSFTFTPYATSVAIEVECTANIAGCAPCFLSAYWGLTADAPFWPSNVGAATTVPLFAMAPVPAVKWYRNGIIDPLSVTSGQTTIVLTGLTPGESYTVEINLLVVGNANSLAIGTGASALDCSLHPDIDGYLRAVTMNSDATVSFIKVGNDIRHPIDTLEGAVAVTASGTGVAMSPDGTIAVATSAGTDSIQVINAVARTVTFTTSTGASTAPGAVCVNPAGTIAYVACFTSNTVVPITLSSGVAGTPIALPGGSGPVAIACTPDGLALIVANNSSHTVSKIVIAGSVVTTSAVFAGTNPRPNSLAIAPDNLTAYVGCKNLGVYPVTVSTLAIGTLITGYTGIGGSRPDGGVPIVDVAIGPDGRWLAIGSDTPLASKQIQEYDLIYATIPETWMADIVTPTNPLGQVVITQGGAILETAPAASVLTTFYGSLVRIRAASMPTLEHLRCTVYPAA